MIKSVSKIKIHKHKMKISIKRIADLPKLHKARSTLTPCI